MMWTIGIWFQIFLQKQKMAIKYSWTFLYFTMSAIQMDLTWSNIYPRIQKNHANNKKK